MSESLEDIKKELDQERRKVKILEEKVTAFEMPGNAKLYYSLNRNMNDLADMLNARSLKTVNIDDASDKTMERMKIIWSAIKSLSETVATLGQSAGVTGDEEKDMKKKTSFLDKFAG